MENTSNACHANEACYEIKNLVRDRALRVYDPIPFRIFVEKIGIGYTYWLEFEYKGKFNKILLIEDDVNDYPNIHLTGKNIEELQWSVVFNKCNVIIKFLDKNNGWEFTRTAHFGPKSI